jgi:tetratricopeptide (TPR) repeat protein
VPEELIPAQSESPSGWKRVAAWCAGVLALVAIVAVAWLLNRPSAAEILVQAQRSFARNDFKEAERLGLAAAEKSDRSPAGLLIAARAALRLGRAESALAYLDRVENDGSPDFTEAAALTGEILLHEFHQAGDAEGAFTSALSTDPRHVASLHGIVAVLSLGGRIWEAQPFIMQLIQLDECAYQELMFLGSDPTEFQPSPLLEECQRASRKDPAVLTGLALAAANENRRHDARVLLRQALQRRPGMTEARARLGALLLDERDDTDVFLRWQAELPPEANSHPNIWATRAEWAARSGQRREAVRCYWETLRLDPNHRRANYQIARLLTELGKEQEAALFNERSAGLQRLHELEAQLSQDSPEYPLAHKMVLELESLGRIWEAAAWCRVVLERNPHAEWPAPLLEHYGSILATNPPLTLDRGSPARQVDFSGWPLPRWSEETSAKPTHAKATD